ncbi:sugar kinase [Streptomyces lateritius]|uniref:sugar kinase n=1 Tax=Streptomyces lateritius TaxID=67313 RepID=UPI0019A91185|nr:sugar kinase [Streptomyces lateritius]GGT83375.1 carbohydrate kinase [Streptomyces lateritius]
MSGNPTVGERSVDGRSVDVACLGESMVTFLPSRPGRLAEAPSFTRTIGGAESNVACALAVAGHRVKWVSQVGQDGFGDHLVEAIGAYGVDVSAVGRDALRPTGIYFRTATDRATDEHEVVYYRAGSAASAMSPATVGPEAVGDARVLHLSGITAALSDDCLALMRELTAPREGRPTVSFDVNFRPALWREASHGGGVLLELARDADLVFVGADEAEAAWGVAGPEAVRALLPEPATLVVKRGGRGAVVFERDIPAGPGGHAPDTPTGTDTPTPTDTVTFAAAPRVDVVAPVGAGDAFAAGFLSGTLRGLPVRERIRHGHLMAAAALTAPGDLGHPPARRPPATPHAAAPRRSPWIAHADRLVALDDAAWGRLHLGPGWTRTGADQEGRTP